MWRMILPLGLLVACSPASVKLDGDAPPSDDTGVDDADDTASGGGDDTAADSGDDSGDNGGTDTGGDNGGTDTGGTDTGGDNGGTDTGGDNGGEDTAPPPEPIRYVGDNNATIDVVYGGTVLYSTSCAGEIEVVVDPDGVATGDATCQPSDWGEPYVGAVTGRVSGGAFTGEWTIDIYGSPLVLELSGSVTDARFDAEYFASFDWYQVTGSMGATAR